MPILLPQAKLAFFFVPKVACTSFKHFAYEIENGRPFEPFTINGARQHIHLYYTFTRFAKVRHRSLADWDRWAMVREPKARVVSCYRNRVLAQKALVIGGAEQAVAEAGLDPKPSLSAFVARLPEYQAASPAVRFHTRPLSYALGQNSDYFTRIFRFSEIDALADAIGGKAGTRPALPHLQTRGPAMSVADLTAEDAARIDALYAEDYEIFGDWL